MSAFTPTIAIIFTEDGLQEAAAAGFAGPAEIIQQVEKFFTSVSLSDKPTANFDAVTVLATGAVVTHFNAMVVGTFRSEGILHLQLASGDVIAITA